MSDTGTSPQPRPSPRRRTGRGARRTPTIRPSQLLAIAVVLAVFITGLIVAGVLGAVLVGVLSLGAGALLVLRWHALNERVRVFRAAVVVIGIAVAITLLFR